MSKIDLHIVSFNVPLPANYGGVIDVFYKLKNLHEAGLKIHLHCYHYGRAEVLELEKYCTKVSYYQRKSGLMYQLSPLPYIVRTRGSKELIDNLLKDDAPILFEGLHTCAFLSHPSLKLRMKIVRAHNIEHEYYAELAKRSHSLYKKMYYFIDSWRLKHYEKVLKHANYVLAISEKDQSYFSKNYPSTLVMPFHGNDGVNSKLGKGDYILYHGNLMVPENSKIALWIINNLCAHLDFPLVIAGKNPVSEILELAKGKTNINIIANPSDREMQKIISDAHVNLLFTEQSTGLKLKLLYAMTQGRFCLCNSLMLAGTGIGKSVIEVEMDEVAKIIEEIKSCFERDFSENDLVERRDEMQIFDNRNGVERILNLLF